MSGLFKSTVIKGNRITDFAQTTATVGVPIPKIIGRAPTDGNVIFAPLPPKENRVVKRQGKGGTKTESFTYTLSYAIAFCQGPIFGYWWIKRNGKVVWTQDPNAPIDDAAYAAKWAQKATFYYGTDSQLPDSTIESYEGSGNVSAFRFLAYVVVENDDVTDGGGAVPSYEAVPIASPSEVYFTSHPYAQTFNTDAKGNLRPTGGLIKTVVLETEPLDEEVTTVFEPIGGTLSDPPLPYMLDDAALAFLPTGGMLLVPPVPYMFDATDNSFAPIGGTMKNPPEGEFLDDTECSFAPSGGSMDTVVVGGWSTTATLSAAATSNTWSNYTMRVTIPAAALVAGSKLRLTFRAPSGNSLVISGAAIQLKAGSGDQFDFSTTPITILFGGASGVTIAANATQVTDDITMTIAPVDLVLAVHYTTAAAIRYTTGATGWETWYRGGSSDITTVNPSSYGSLGANTAGLITLVEVYSP